MRNDGERACAGGALVSKDNDSTGHSAGWGAVTTCGRGHKPCVAGVWQVCGRRHACVLPAAQPQSSCMRSKGRRAARVMLLSSLLSVDFHELQLPPLAFPVLHDRRHDAEAGGAVWRRQAGLHAQAVVVGWEGTRCGDVAAAGRNRVYLTPARTTVRADGASHAYSSTAPCGAYQATRAVANGVQCRCAGATALTARTRR
jgi:hypothetical protein